MILCKDRALLFLYAASLAVSTLSGRAAMNLDRQIVASGSQCCQYGTDCPGSQYCCYNSNWASCATGSQSLQKGYCLDSCT